MKIVTSRWLKPTRLKIGVLMVVIVFSAGLYIAWSVNTWSTYQTHPTDLQNNVRAEIKSALGLKVETHEERIRKLDALQASRNMLLTDIDSLCHVNIAIDWQNFIGDLKERKKECTEVQSQLTSLRNSLDKVTAYLRGDHMLAKALSALPGGGELAEGDWPKQRDGYQAVLRTISDLQASPDFASVKQTAVDRLTITVAAWEEVLAAHGAKDRARYIKATKALAESYDELTAVGKISSDRLDEVIKPFENSYIKS